jgi:hypothetical protein
MKSSCFFCGHVGTLEVHHIVGRINGVPIHHGLVVKLCGPCNLTQFKLWKVARLDARSPSMSITLRRTAAFFAIRGRELDGALAHFLTEQAEELEVAS